MRPPLRSWSEVLNFGFARLALLNDNAACDHNTRGDFAAKAVAVFRRPKRGNSRPNGGFAFAADNAKVVGWFIRHDALKVG